MDDTSALAGDSILLYVDSEISLLGHWLFSIFEGLLSCCSSWSVVVVTMHTHTQTQPPPPPAAGFRSQPSTTAWKQAPQFLYSPCLIPGLASWWGLG